MPSASLQNKRADGAHRLLFDWAAACRTGRQLPKFPRATTFRLLFVLSYPGCRYCGWRFWMAIRDMLLPEFDQEMANTRKLLERLPEQISDYKPHAKSMPMNRLAGHVAELPGWAKETFTKEVLEFDMENFVPFNPKTRQEVLDYLRYEFQSRPRGPGRCQRRRLRRDLEPEEHQGRHHLRDAARCLLSRHGDEPHDPSSCTAWGLSAAQ